MTNDLTLVQHIGKYQIRGMLGRGSTGIVYLGFDPQLQRQVAVKVLQIARAGMGETPTDFQSNKHVVKRFLAEAQSAGKLRHPNIIALFEGDVQGPSPFLVMEYVEGQSLDSIIKGGKRFSIEELLTLLNQLASAIDYAHSQGVLHRDIKPGNILIDTSGKPYVLDFGVAKIHEQISIEDEGVRPTAVLGTPAYMSPEQIHNQPLNSHSDLFAFGIVAFQCLCGIRPFDGDTFTAVASSILEKPPRQASSLRRDIQSAVDLVFEKALAKERSHRYDSGKEFVSALETALRSPRDNVTSSRGGQIQDSSPIARSEIRSLEPVARPKDKRTKMNLLRVKRGESAPLKPTSPILVILVVGVLAIVLISSITYLFWPRRPTLVVASDTGQAVPKVVIDTPSQQPPPNIDPQTPDIPDQPKPELIAANALVLKISQSNDGAALPPMLSELKSLASSTTGFSVTELLQHSNFLVKIAALKIMIDRRENVETPRIVPLLDDVDPLVRGFSAKALGILGGKELATILAQKASKERVPEVIRALENAIERIAERS